MEKLSPELEELLSSFFKLRKLLEQLLPKEAIDYIINLIAKDCFVAYNCMVREIIWI